MPKINHDFSISNYLVSKRVPSRLLINVKIFLKCRLFLQSYFIALFTALCRFNLRLIGKIIDVSLKYAFNRTSKKGFVKFISIHSFQLLFGEKG
ncbi:hypothetical protein BpHYR1_053062 [Brachionus plicatilis]|uniref:Uncharacterized protein n=1 Tax=Brachionus plicatilis TaxID=10195 RepID=A0A3M7T0S2_BRAPC|nr:hypothetical protein BpHYR1_053062 [Brachionus plicatilis]